MFCCNGLTSSESNNRRIDFVTIEGLQKTNSICIQLYENLSNKEKLKSLLKVWKCSTSNFQALLRIIRHLRAGSHEEVCVIN